MKLKDVMRSPVQTIEAEAPLREAAIKMKLGDVGALPVLSHGVIAGIVTDRDLIVRGFSEAPAARFVSDAMTPDPICASQDADVQHAMDMMMAHAIGRIIVIDENARPVGMISAGDVATAYSGGADIGRLAVALSHAHRRS